MQPINYFAAYYYTGASVKGEQLWSCTKRVIQELGVRGFLCSVWYQTWEEVIKQCGSVLE